MSLLTLGVMAVPAKRQRRTITLDDGSRIEAVRHGDEHLRCFMSEDGRMWHRSRNGIHYEEIDPQTALEKRQTRVAASNERRVKRRSRWGAESNPISGSYRGLVILVEFPNKKMSYPQSEFNDFFNKVGYNSNNMSGSVHDYFLAQSYGVFDLTFDVIGPLEVSEPYQYYGENIGDDDAHAAEMVIEACRMANSSVNFADYDWDNDGEVDQVYVVYAGNGESQSDDEYTIWPHEFTLEEAAKIGDGSGPLRLDGVIINTYACSSELCSDTDIIIDGIGTACHEFSHCMCLPDMYDVNGKCFGMDSWDLLDYGCYNGPTEMGECPAAFTSYERMYCGWLTPIELSDGCVVTGMQPLTSAPEAYIIYNEAYRNEYYLLENRQLEGFDAYGYGHGMLILHVDFDSSVWEANKVNTIANHQRMTLIPADGVLSVPLSSMAGDPWPGTSHNTALTDTSSPAAKLYNANSDGRLYMGKPIEGITETNGLISFVFNGGYSLPAPVADEDCNVAGRDVTVSWSSVKQALSYEVSLMWGNDDEDDETMLLCSDEIATPGSGKHLAKSASIYETTATSLTFHDLEERTAYTFMVRAVGADGLRSDWSNVVGFVTQDGTSVAPPKEAGQGSAVVFDLTGRRVLRPQHGLYIVNGRKVLK